VRGTRQAETLNEVLTGLPGFRSAQNIHAELRRRGPPTTRRRCGEQDMKTVFNSGKVVPGRTFTRRQIL
jgi:hypothetical protein